MWIYVRLSSSVCHLCCAESMCVQVGLCWIICSWCGSMEIIFSQYNYLIWIFFSWCEFFRNYLQPIRFNLNQLKLMRFLVLRVQRTSHMQSLEWMNSISTWMDEFYTYIKCFTNNFWFPPTHNRPAVSTSVQSLPHKCSKFAPKLFNVCPAVAGPVLVWRCTRLRCLDLVGRSCVAVDTWCCRQVLCWCGGIHVCHVLML